MEIVIQIMGYLTTATTFISLIGGVVFYFVKISNRQLIKEIEMERRIKRMKELQTILPKEEKKQFYIWMDS